MEKIKKYVVRFYEKVEMRPRYDLSRNEWRALTDKAREGGAVDAVCLAFLYGYAKGYRAAKAEQKQKEAGKQHERPDFYVL